MPDRPRPFLPSSDELAVLAADYPHPILLWAIGHDLIVHAAAGQLLAKAHGLVGCHLMDRPLDKQARWRVFNATLRALRGEVVTYGLALYGEHWTALVAPLYVEGEIKGAIGQAVRQSSADAVSDPPQSFLVVRDLEPCRVGDVLTVSTSGSRPIQRHSVVAQGDFDRLLTAGALMPADPVSDPVPIPAQLCGAPPPRLALMR